jgi:adenosylcobinamide-phosphate synthase
MADLLDSGDLDGARALLGSLCGRDPDLLDGPGLARAACESVAENTSDATVAPLLWAAVGGDGGVAGGAVGAMRPLLGTELGHPKPRSPRWKTLPGSGVRRSWWSGC